MWSGDSPSCSSIVIACLTEMQLLPMQLHSGESSLQPTAYLMLMHVHLLSHGGIRRHEKPGINLLNND